MLEAEMKSPRTVSVIMPTFQRANYLERAISSVFSQQTSFETIIECIVVDDGSTDATPDVVARIQPPAPHRLTYLRTDHLGAPGLVRNVGLRASTSEFIGYCDSDDIWLPFHLETCLREFAVLPQLVMVETWWSIQELRPTLRGFQSTYMLLATDGRTTTTNSRLHRRSVLALSGYFGDQSWGEDIDLWTRISFCGPVRRLKIPTTVHSYTYGGNNVSFRHNLDLATRYDAAPIRDLQTHVSATLRGALANPRHTLLRLGKFVLPDRIKHNTVVRAWARALLGLRDR